MAYSDRIFWYIMASRTFILTNERGQLADIGATQAIRPQEIIGKHGEGVGEEHPHEMRQSREEASLKYRK